VAQFAPKYSGVDYGPKFLKNEKERKLKELEELEKLKKEGQLDIKTEEQAERKIEK
jgi:hypothetical protein